LLSGSLEPAKPSDDFKNPVFKDNFQTKMLDPSWKWIDKFGDCLYKLTSPDGLEIHAAYCGEYKEGTATIFRSFRIWKKHRM